MGTVGQKIKDYRKTVKLNQTKLAEKAEISRTYLSDVENDRYKPSVSLLKKISEALAGAGGVIRIGDVTYQNNSASLYTIIYNSLMEAADYISLDNTVGLTDDLMDEQDKKMNSLKRQLSEANLLQLKLKDLTKTFDSLNSELTEESKIEISKLLHEIGETENKLLSTFSNISNLKEGIKETNKVIENVMDKTEDKILSYEINQLLQNYGRTIEWELENLFNSNTVLTINGRTLNDEEKKKALQILKLTFDK